MFNLTFTERARTAYQNNDQTLADLLEQAAELEADNEALSDKLWDSELEIDELNKKIIDLEKEVEALRLKLAD